MSGDDKGKAVNLEQIRQLIDLLIEKDVGEFELDQRGVKVKIRRMGSEVTTTLVPAMQAPYSGPSQPGAAAGPAGGQAAADSPPEEDEFSDAYIVTSPIVGSFYRSPEPEADPFTDVGEEVEEGQTLCIVEAMKLMNEIASDVAGEVLAVFLENGEPVEYGQRLFAIKPSD
jgi:acetyl-CoA carboxylase biotin carboxyl carrier protein